MLAPFLLLALSAAPKLASPGWSAIDVAPEKVGFWADTFAQRLEAKGFEVVTNSQLAAVLGFERQRQLMGCSEGRCLAELGGALGVDAIIVAGVSKVGNGFAANVKVVSATSGASLVSTGTRVDSEAALLDWIESAASEVADRLLARSRTFGPRWALAGAGVGAAALAVGAVLLGVGKGAEGALRAGDASITSTGQLDATLGNASSLQGAGVGLLIGGAALGLAGGALFLLGGDRGSGPQLAVAPSGPGVVVGGSF